MGHINCHCQYIPSDEYDTIKHQPESLPVLTTEQNEPTQIVTKMTLRGANKAIDIPLAESNKLTFGTTDDSLHRYESLTANSFKIQVKFRNRCVFLKDCGIGLGAFLMKRKVVRRVGSPELLLGVLDKWVVLKILQSKQISCCIHTTGGSSQTLLEQKEQHQIELGECRLTIRRDENGKQFSIRRKDRREIWVLLGEERKIKTKDVLRLGLELFEIASINTYLECSTIIKKY